MIQSFLIKGEAIPASRPRAVPNKNDKLGFRVLKSKDDRDWQESIRRQVQACKPYCFSRETPIKFIFFAFYHKPTKSTYKTAISHSLGDLDNISKNLQDALQSRTVKVGRLKIKQKGLCFEDDSQIVRLIGHKAYTDKEDYVIVRITDEIFNKDVEWL